MRDSAGIRIVEMPQTSPHKEWRVAAAPSLSLGAVDGPAEYQLAEVAGVVQLGDGRVVVADGGAHALRFYDARGRHLQSTGRRGNGPGEFEQMGGLWRFRGDSLAVWDLRQARLSVYSPSGELVRTVLPQPGPRGAYAPLYGMFSDGSFVLGAGMNMGEIFAGGSRRFRDRFQLVRYGADGIASDTVGEFPDDKRDAEVAGTGFSLTPVPFGKRTFVAIGGKRGFVATGDAPEVAVFEPGKRPSLIVRQNRPARPVRDEDISAYRQHALTSADPRERPAIEARLRRLQFPKTMAPFGAIRAGAGDHVWLRATDTPGGARPSLWTVLSPAGELVAEVELPAGFVPYQITETGVLGVTKGESDEPYVQIYPLSRG
ncbi:MAG TPA: hypothetical protein VK358_15660 [Longimicrobium sp.]|nr:hypothetical protein [Longimicrobium sp.]